MRARLAQIFCLAIGILLCGGLLAELLLYSQNTLLNNGNWIVAKRKLAMAVVGADEFLLTRAPLAGNALNLGAWHGYQEVSLKGARAFRAVELKFEISQDSYLDIILKKTGEGYSGIRLSRAERYPSQFFESNREGRFILTHPLPPREIPPGWHRAKLLFKESGFSLGLDRERPLSIDSRVTAAEHLGFRAGMAGAKIDDIVAAEANGAHFKESFRRQKGWLKLAAFHSAVLAGFFVLAFLLLAWRLKAAVIFNGSIVVTAQILFCLCAFYAFDFFYWSERPFRPEMRLLSTGAPVPQLYLENLRSGFFRAWANAIEGNHNLWQMVDSENYPHGIFRGPIFCPSSGGKCLESYPAAASQAKKKCLRFVLVGTSQSVGAGAESLEQSFFVRIHQGLRKAFAGKCVESLNLSISGSNLRELTDVFQDYIAFRPDLVAVNLSSNDDANGFYDGLRRFAGINKSTTVFVAEANSVDGLDLTGLKEKHKIMRRAGESLGIETFSMHDFLAQEALMQSGWLWWDHVHLSSYGQALVAEWLLPRLSALLQPGRPARKALD